MPIQSGRVFVWSARKRSLRAKCNVGHPVVGLGFSPDAKHLAVGCKNGALVILDFEAVTAGSKGRDVQPALVIGRHHVTERDSAPVQYNDIV